MYALLTIPISLMHALVLNLSTLVPFAGPADPRPWEPFALLVLAAMGVLGALLAWLWTRRRA